MALNGTAGLDSNLSFTPQTVEEALVPFTKYQQEFEKQQAVNDAVQQGIAKYAPYIDKERDPRSWSLYQHINNQVNTNAGYIGTPGFLLNLDGIRNMKYQYQDASNKFADQLARKQADQEMARQEMLKHPNLQYQFHSNGNMYQLDDLSMDHYWNGARPTFYSVDADDVKKEATLNANALIGQMGGHKEASTWGKVLTGSDASGLVEQIHKTGGTTWAFQGIPPEVTPDMLVNPDEHQDEWNKLLANGHYAKYRDHLESLRNMAQNSAKYFNYILSRTNYDKMSEDGKRKLMESALLGMQQGLNKFSDEHTTQYDETASLRNPGKGDGAGGGNGFALPHLDPASVQAISTGDFDTIHDGWWSRLLDPENTTSLSPLEAFQRFGVDARTMNAEDIDDDFALRDKYGVHAGQAIAGKPGWDFQKTQDINALLDSENGADIIDYMELFDKDGKFLTEDAFNNANKERFTKMMDPNRYASHPKYNDFNKIVNGNLTGVNGNLKGYYEDRVEALKALGFNKKDIDKGITKKDVVAKMKEALFKHAPRKNTMPFFNFGFDSEDTYQMASAVLRNLQTNDGEIRLRAIESIGNDEKDVSKIKFNLGKEEEISIEDLLPAEKSKRKNISFHLSPHASGPNAGIVMKVGDKRYFINGTQLPPETWVPMQQNYARFQMYQKYTQENEKAIKRAENKKPKPEYVTLFMPTVQNGQVNILPQQYEIEKAREAQKQNWQSIMDQNITALTSSMSDWANKWKGQTQGK